MTTAKSVGIKKDTSLGDLQTIVQQQEGLLGPLIALGHGLLLASDGITTEQDLTVLTLDMDQAPPAKRATLRQAVGGQAVPVAGSTPICTGDCYVSGEIQTIAAYRPQ
jgi:hypothetical protein